eukprot:12416453-Karenia_brevis.AAC.1
MFVAVVVSVMASAMVCFPISTKQTKALNHAYAGMVRKILQGAACGKVEKSDGGIKYKSETDENLCEMFGLHMYEDVL